MSWMQKLYQTYNEVEKNARLSDSDKEKLAPLWHSPQTAHIQIILDNKGNFQSAKVLEEKPIIMLPVTEASEGRTSGLAPHALSDSLQYIAKDLGLTYTKEEYIEEEGANGKKKKIKQKKEELIFNLYAKQLAGWCACTDNVKVLAVQTYIQKGTVLADLIKNKIIPTDSDGQPLDNWNDKQEGKENKPALFNVLTKEKGKFEIRKALVVWAVQIPKGPVSEVWKDKAVQQSWAEYYQATLSRNFCLVLGDEQSIRTSHPAKLTYSGDKAKLISSNDKDGYTFRGRFEEAEEAVSMSAEVSHKAHAALRWLIGRQGIRNGEPVTVAWAVNGKIMPSPFKDNYDYLTDEDDYLTDEDDDLDLMPIEEGGEDKQPEKSGSELDWSVNFGQAAAQIIKKKLHGFKAELKEHEQISLLMLDSATPGRMALTYYQEFLPADYFANLDQWVDDFSWYQRHSQETKSGKKTDKKTVWPYLPPSPYAVFETLYGKVSDKDGKLKKQLYARLLPVIAGGKNVPLPFDFVQQSFQAACSPSGYERWEWERNVGVACALFKGYHARHYDESQRRNYPMALDKENRSRDYLYGRLLAIAENIESYALYLAEEKRATTAERYMQRFAEHPFATWRNIELALAPYQDRLRNRGKDTGKQAIGEIMDLFQNEDFTCDNKLSGEFLLGYHCQKMEINRQIAALKAKKDAAKNKSETQLTEQN